MSQSGQIDRLFAAVAAFRDMPEDGLVAATATGDGGIARLTYGDLMTLLRRLLDASERLGRIGGWHARETGPAGMVGDYCVDCGHVWPCDTRRMAEGTYSDEEEVSE